MTDFFSIGLLIGNAKKKKKCIGISQDTPLGNGHVKGRFDLKMFQMNKEPVRI